jgi:hypothetical protein
MCGKLQVATTQRVVQVGRSSHCVECSSRMPNVRNRTNQIPTSSPIACFRPESGFGHSHLAGTAPASGPASNWMGASASAQCPMLACTRGCSAITADERGSLRGRLLGPQLATHARQDPAARILAPCCIVARASN